MEIFASHLPCNIIFFTSFLQSVCVCCRLQNAGIVIFNRSLISTLLNLLCKKKKQQKNKNQNLDFWSSSSQQVEQKDLAGFCMQMGIQGMMHLLAP